MKEILNIDLVVPWVDGSDSKWIKEKQKYTAHLPGDNTQNRYRDWKIMKYWFRSAEKNLPWIRKIHFITYGHLPDFLDKKSPKLSIVNHKDYIPEKYLPTYNSHAIELNLHRIKDLSEYFIYANDDTFFLKPLQPEFFFKKGLPADAAIQNVLQFKSPGGISHITANDIMCINRNFSKSAVIKQNFFKWFNIKYGGKIFFNAYLMPFKNFTGFNDHHMPGAFLKSTWRDVWYKFGTLLDETCSHKVRNNSDVNQWLMRYWQIASGKFVPVNPNRGNFYSIGDDDEKIRYALKNRSIPMICINDTRENYQNDMFEKECAFLDSCFSEIFPQKSSFEK